MQLVPSHPLTIEISFPDDNVASFGQNWLCTWGVVALLIYWELKYIPSTKINIETINKSSDTALLLFQIFINLLG